MNNTVEVKHTRGESNPVIEIFTLIIQTVFIILKLTNVIQWSWVIVFLPSMIYGGIVVFLIFLVGLLLLPIICFGQK